MVRSVDEFQRRHPVLGFPLAVVYKYFDDQGPYLAATLTYYAFVAIFPLMLLGSSILGFVLDGQPQWRDAIIDSAFSQFPIIGDQLGRPEGLTGSVRAIVVGALVALYGCLGLGQALQNTQHVAWSVPRNSRPNPFRARFKTLVLLLTAGLTILTVSVVATLSSTTDLVTHWIPAPLRWLVPFATVLLIGVFLTALFRLAATGQHSFRKAAPGGFALALMWQALQYFGATYVQHVLIDTGAMAKTFGLVLGLVGFLFIGAVMAVLATEINVVLGRRLWPRALLTPFTDNVRLTDADRRAYAAYARMQRHKGFEQVRVHWDDAPAGDHDDAHAEEQEPPAGGVQAPAEQAPSA